METSSAPEGPSTRHHDAICWQVYPLGFCGAPLHREDLLAETYGDQPGSHVVHRLDRIVGWLDHLLELGANVLILNPVFESVSHGYDTLDHLRIDPRLGSREDFDALLAACHERGIRVVLDGVFNHVSSRHPLVRRALADGPDSEAGALIRWSGKHPYGFEGNPDLVELDLSRPAVQERIAQVMTLWLDRGIDGWRLDAMYAAGAEAWAPILDLVRLEDPDAWILGEVIHGDYRAVAAGSGADAVTQYELWKAIWSSANDRNLFELAHALERHEGFVHGTEVAGDGHPGTPFLPLTFLGNHDTTRIASRLADGRDLVPATALLALLPGIPAVYAGDELGAVGVKEDRPGGDDAVRPLFPSFPADLRTGIDPEGRWRGASPEGTSPPLALLSTQAAPRLFELHQRLLGLRRRHPWLSTGHVHVDQESLTATSARILLSENSGAGSGARPAAGAGAAGGSGRLALHLNIGDEELPLAGDEAEPVLTLAAGGDVLDATGTPSGRTVPAHGIAVTGG
ncbi:glycosidase [Brachybacterium endophyticum]|uniref:Glycosidase n=1 Tax=Brachybacterium endophyticum TaxID=2182385 RepID=A0A2U2RJP3_9MICO|nr:alpha-amylase family glycosyl hydrolase [Brachybacterium endophyticum]PWH06099.1 glycosidase [Brachybacterium endophyticum]